MPFCAAQVSGQTFKGLTPGWIISTSLSAPHPSSGCGADLRCQGKVVRAFWLLSLSRSTQICVGKRQDPLVQNGQGMRGWGGAGDGTPAACGPVSTSFLYQATWMHWKPPETTSAVLQLVTQLEKISCAMFSYWFSFSLVQRFQFKWQKAEAQNGKKCSELHNWEKSLIFWFCVHVIQLNVVTVLWFHVQCSIASTEELIME